MSAHFYLDIDGVLVTEPTPPIPNDFTARDIRVGDGRFVPVAYSEAVISTLAEVLAAGAPRLTTVSSWEGDAPYLFRAIGLPEVPWLDLSGQPGASIFERKHSAVLEHASDSPPRRIVWIDDHLPKSEEERRELAESLPTEDSLLLSPIARECLTPGHLGLVADFLHSRS
ncbi:hypothetical protein GCM10022261_07120 [Brevibacterium daeguense]|uniref:Uncharacterized protein n=1 Tax=Brevibacterium daeguense TaxID=909936 RepID=A0ABP8EGT6_9MICO|nr:HAD domain-containing protein [Brevibacterium daeguense]